MSLKIMSIEQTPCVKLCAFELYEVEFDFPAAALENQRVVSSPLVRLAGAHEVYYQICRYVI